jgi:RNA polymerase sigma-70 factor (ECF subfamily)
VTVTEGPARVPFEQAVLPHLNAAYNLARWLTRNPHDAEDVVQEAYLRAVRYYQGFAGGDGKAWLLSIVRHTCFTWLRKNRPAELAPLADDVASAAEEEADPSDPESLALASRDRALLNRLIQALPPEFREVIVLRELEDLSYREIADVTAVPVGTVMSRLNRARARLRRAWLAERAGEGHHAA